MPLTVLFKADVTSRGGTLKAFKIVEGRGVNPQAIAEIYNSVLGPLDRGVAVNTNNIVMRLARDRRSVYVGFLDERPCSVINVVRRIDLEIPDTHQKLTDDDTFDSTLEDGALSWFCPWVAVLPEARGYSFTETGTDKRMSLGQLHVWQVKKDALEDDWVEQLFAYSRPINIRDYLKGIGESSGAIQTSRERPSFLLKGQKLDLKQKGILLAGSDEMILSMQSYWETKHPDKPDRRYDDVFHFHGSLGAQFRPNLVKPYGHCRDLLSLCYRIPLEYVLEGKRQ